MSFQPLDQQTQSFEGQTARRSMPVPEPRTANRESLPSTDAQAVSLNTADLFLKIFCEPESGAAASPEQSGEAGDAGARSGLVGRLRVLGKLGVFCRELRAALSDDRPSRRRGIAVAAAILFMTVAIAGGHYLHPSPTREIKALLQAGRNDKSLALANDYLGHTPSAKAVRKLATEALAKAVVPEWNRLVTAGQFQQATARLTEGLQRSDNNPEGSKLLALLQWIGDLQQFAAERGGLDQPFVLFRDEKPVQDLLDRWGADVAGNQVMLVRISNHVADFEPMRVRVSSQLRELQSTFKVYLQASNTLRAELTALLNAGDANAASSRLAQFQEAYPHASGTAILADDIARFGALRQAVAARDLNGVLQQYETQYQTSLVADATAAWSAAHVPPRAAMDRHRKALTAWKRGESKAAMALLRELQDEAWGEMAKARIDRFHRITTTFSSLVASQDRDDYRQRLLSFYQTLRPSEDRYFIEALEIQAHIFRQMVMDEAEQHFQQVMTHWNAYQNKGGLTGLLRLEKAVSQAFRQRAEHLKRAFVAVSRAAELYRLAARDMPAERRELHDEVLGETMRQRQWLRELGLVLAPTLLQAKLELLPELMEEGN